MSFHDGETTLRAAHGLKPAISETSRSRRPFQPPTHHAAATPLPAIFCSPTLEFSRAGLAPTYAHFGGDLRGGGGTYVVAWGAIIFGAIQFFRGVSQSAGEQS